MLRLQKHDKAGLTRKRHVIGDRSAINQSFSQNDYLGLANDKRVIKAFCDGANKYGVGSSSAPTLSGFYAPHQALEEAMAEWLNRERALLFTSGYAANIGVFSARYQRHDHVIADKECHASTLDGIALSRTHLHRYHHLDLAHAEELASKHEKAILVSESVFGMTGEITNISELVQTKRRHGCELIIDDAHGAHIINHAEYMHEIDMLVTPLGKIFGGQGAIVSGRDEDIEILLQFSRSYLFSTALPPAIACANLAALRIMQTEPELLERLRQNIRYFISRARELAVPLISYDETPIKAIPIASTAHLMQLHAKLMEAGFLVAAIRPPTAPTPRIRISLSLTHETLEIERLLQKIAEFL